MKYFLTTAFVCILLFSVLALVTTLNKAAAQVVEPFIEAPFVELRPINVRCMSHKNFSVILKEKSMKIIATSSHLNETVVKTVFTNYKDIITANIFPDGNVCVTDILENAYFSKEFTNMNSTVN